MQYSTEKTGIGKIKQNYEKIYPASKSDRRDRGSAGPGTRRISSGGKPLAVHLCPKTMTLRIFHAHSPCVLSCL